MSIHPPSLYITRELSFTKNIDHIWTPQVQEIVISHVSGLWHHLGVRGWGGGGTVAKVSQSFYLGGGGGDGTVAKVSQSFYLALVFTLPRMRL